MDEPNVVGQSVGPYHVIARIGAGGMGEVYLGHDPRLQRRVALKCLTAAETRTGDVRTRVLREARAAARLTHPNIAGVYDVLEQDERTFIVMEYVEGESLAARLTRGPLPVDEVRAIGRQLASALNAAHLQGVIHRDLKPANIHMAADGSIKILDFGVAKLTPAISDSTGAPTGGTLAEVTLPGNPGTPIYMSPEQLFSHPIDGRSDIYSAGVVLFEMATGRRPYLETGAVALALAMTSGPPPAADAINPGVPPELSAALARALEREPDKRFQSARELESALTSTDAATGSHAVVTRTATAARVSGWRRAWMLAAVAVVLLAIGVAARKPLMIRFGLESPPPPAVVKPELIVLLPVNNLTGDSRGVQYGTTLTGLAGSNLAGIDGFAVNFYEGKADAVHVMRERGAAFVLEVSVTAVEPAAQLVVRGFKAGVATAAWEQRLDGDLMAVTQALLGGLAGALERARGVKFSIDDRARLGHVPTANPDALQKYAEGRAFLFRREGGDIDKAIAAFQAAVDRDPRFVEAWSILGASWSDRFQRDSDPASSEKALVAVRNALALDPDQSDANFVLALVEQRTGKLEDAEATIRRLLQRHPNQSPAHRLLGEILADRNRIDEAVEHLRLALALNRDANNAYMLGVVLYRSGRYRDAIDAFRTVTEIAPENAIGYQMLGATSYILGDTQQAIGNLEHAMRIGPTAATFANLGLVYYDTGRFEDALHAYEQALQKNPKSIDTQRNIGDVYARLGRQAEARRSYEQALALGRDLMKVNPRGTPVIAMMALCEAKLGHGDAARQLAAEAVALQPTNRIVLQRSAEVHALLGEPDAALRDLAAAIKAGFEPRMARREDELSSLRGLPEFERLTKEQRP